MSAKTQHLYSGKMYHLYMTHYFQLHPYKSSHKHLREPSIADTQTIHDNCIYATTLCVPFYVRFRSWDQRDQNFRHWTTFKKSTYVISQFNENSESVFGIRKLSLYFCLPISSLYCLKRFQDISNLLFIKEFNKKPESSKFGLLYFWLRTNLSRIKSRIKHLIVQSCRNVIISVITEWDHFWSVCP